MEKKNHKGQLIYSSPKCALGPRIRVSAFYLFLVCGAFIIGFGIFNHELSLTSLWLTLGICGPILFAAQLIAGHNLYPHFKIYENGITNTMTHEWHPFGDCDEVEHSVDIFDKLAGRPAPDFIYWEDIACFERVTSDTPTGPIVFIHLKTESEVNPSPRGDHPIRLSFIHADLAGYHSKQKIKDSQETMENIIKQLKKHDIPEIPFECEHCDKKARPPLRVCPHCGERRF